MHITRIARISIAAAAAALAAIPYLAVGTAQAMPPSVRTLEYWGPRAGLVVTNEFNCTPATHGGLINPETVWQVSNTCPYRVYLHGYSGQTFCVSPNTIGDFSEAWVVKTLQVSSNLSHC